MRLKVEYDLEDQIREGLGDTLLIESQIRDSILENKYELELDEERYPHMNRKLGASERVAWLCDQAGSVNFVVVARVMGLLDEHVLRTALDLLPQRHPILRTRIEVQEGEPVFVSQNVPEIPLRVEVRYSDDHWHTEAEKEIDHSLPWPVGPLIRVTLLKSPHVSDVLITFHHAIGDGTSSIYLVRDLLNLVGQITEGVTSDITSFPERPPVEDLLPKSAHGLNGLVKTIDLLGKQLKTIIFRHPQKLPIDSNTLPYDRRVRIIHGVLSPEETTSLIARCREEDTTVHGAFCAALLKAAAHQIYSMRSDTKPLTIGCMSAIDLRRFLSPPIDEEVGLFISMAITAHHVSEDTKFWDLARDARKAVHQSIENGEPFVFLSLLDRFLANDATPSDLAGLVSKVYPSAMLVTNLGRITIPERYGPLVLQEVHFAAIDKAIAEHFIAAIVTYRNKLVMNFSYVEPTLSHECAAELAEDAMKILRSALHSDEDIDFSIQQ